MARAVAGVEEVSTPKTATTMTGASTITREAATQLIPRTTIAEMNGVMPSTTSVLAFRSAEELAVDKGGWPPSSRDGVTNIKKNRGFSLALTVNLKTGDEANSHRYLCRLNRLNRLNR